MLVRLGEPKSRFRRLALPLFEADVSSAAIKKAAAVLPRDLRQVVERAVTTGAFKGRKGEVLLLVPSGNDPSVDGLVLIGLGAEKKWSLELLRRTTGVLARRFARDGSGAVGVDFGSPRVLAAAKAFGLREAAQAATEGWIAGAYVFDKYKTSGQRRQKKPPTLHVMLGSLSAVQKRAASEGVRRGGVISDAVNFSRELSNAPANELYPEVLASRARSMARSCGLTAQVLTVPDLVRLKMGALLGVGQGSDRPARCIVLKYQPRAKPKATLALVGKAVTFDSGGLSIKPAKGMEEMKFDMAGGAAVLGAMQAIAGLRPPVRVVAVVPCAENMINGSAVRPGDILRSASGKTIEVLNTDAEGRLILADALHYAQRFKPDYMLDFATLTGACLVALGTTVTGLVSNHDGLVRQVHEAGERAGERAWQLPLYDEFIEATRSQVADIKNTAGRWGGAITAGAFLSHFVGEVPWCHLDIAGTGWLEREASYLAGGATGVGVRLTCELVEALVAGELDGAGTGRGRR